ncbi:hypothetical protein LguiB_003023 [Lonicera macranthoides]
MRNEDLKPEGATAVPRFGRANGGFIPTSFRAFSRIVSTGASTVASTVRSAASAASAIVDRENDAFHDQVFWAGFDKLECEGGATRRILLLGYRFGFQIWDVEEANNVRELTSRYDGQVSFMQMLPKPLSSKRLDDKFADNRPLLVVCADGLFSGGGYIQDNLAIPSKGNLQNCHDQLNGGFVPTAVWFYSLKSHSYARVLKFRSVVYSVRSSSRIVAVLQASQIHCFDAATLERDYTILTNSIVTSPGCASIGLGPLAVGPRWVAYSGSPIAVSNSGRVSPQHLTPSVSFPGPASNGSLVAHYAKESSKQLAAGIVTLGDRGYKKLSRYYSELLPDGNSSLQLGSVGRKERPIANGHLPDADNVGMVIIRDVVSKSVIAQFKAHKSPISSLCFDPSGTLLVTASVQGHNINVFRIMPRPSRSSASSDSGASYVQLYRLQRGFTNAVIQDISFSDDSNWIMISSTRGTSHLFAISPSADPCFTTRHGGSGLINQQALCASAPPITLSAVSRIRSGNSGWRSTVTGAAAAATGKVNSLSGAIASTFHNCKGKDLYADNNSPLAKYHLLVFSHPGCVIQYALRTSSGQDSSGLSNAYELGPEFDARLVVEAIQKWNIFQKHNRREREENIDIYGENGNQDSGKIFPEGVKKESTVYPEVGAMVTKLKISPEEKNHMYISEAELQMHEPRFPLWAKPEVYFQSMIKDDIKIDEENDLGGEIEIEKIPSRMIEARSKDLVPVLGYLHAPKFRQARVPASDYNNIGQYLHQRSGSSENSRLMCHSSCGSLDSMIEGACAVAELHSGTQETTENTTGYVNKKDIPKLNSRLEIVNNSGGSLRMQSKFVNNNIGPEMENQFEDGDELD